MIRCGYAFFKLNLLFFIILYFFVFSRAYAQSPPEKSKTQEITSVMQKSDFLKNVELEGSTVEACDWDGDDSSCPFRPPESSEFFIRTATKMSCANGSAQTFLKGKKLSYLDLKITDIMDSRSRARSVLSRDTSRSDYDQFKGEERVTFSLVAWTTVESVHQGIEKWSKYDNNRYGGMKAQYFKRGRYFGMIPGYNGVSHGWGRFFMHQGIWLQRVIGGTSSQKSIADAYSSSFSGMKARYETLIGDTWWGDGSTSAEGAQHLLDRNLWVGYFITTLGRNRVSYAVAPLIMPPLAHRVHVIGYDDDVMPNAGEALLRCADEEAGVRGERKVFEPDEAFDRRVCLSHDDWRRAKVGETSSQIAKRNKRFLKAYFAKVYDPESSDVIYRPWEGNPEKTGPYSEEASLVYATYFAVQSCHTGVTDMPDAPLGSVGTAYNRIKSLKDKITTRTGQKSLKETYWRNLKFEGFEGLDAWSCEPYGASNECKCRMELDDDVKNEYYFSIKRWNPVKMVRLNEQHGGDKSELNKVKCFRALEETFADDGVEHHNCSYWRDRSIVTYFESGAKKCKRMAEITKYCAAEQGLNLSYNRSCADRGAE